MDMSLETWVVVIVVTMVLGGSVLWWVTGPSKKKLRLVNNARKRPRE